jgi:hypothetical protein
MPGLAMIDVRPASTVTTEVDAMIKSMGRGLLGMVMGSAILIAMMIAYAVDVTDREDGIRDVL